MTTEAHLEEKLIPADNQQRSFNKSIFNDKSPIEISYTITINAKIKNQPDKTILQTQQGIIPA